MVQRCGALCAPPAHPCRTADVRRAPKPGPASSAQPIEEVHAQQHDADQHAGVAKRSHPQSDATAEFRIELDQAASGHGEGVGRQRIASVAPSLHIRAIPPLGAPTRVVRAGENTDL